MCGQAREVLLRSTIFLRDLHQCIGAFGMPAMSPVSFRVAVFDAAAEGGTARQEWEAPVLFTRALPVFSRATPRRIARHVAACRLVMTLD